MAKGFTAIVCTLNAYASQYFSVVFKDDSVEKRGRAIKEAIRAYQGSTLKTITVYRTGLNAQNPLQEADELIAQFDDMKITYITVQKRTIVKLMAITDWTSGNLENPPAGKTILPNFTLFSQFP